MSEGVSYSKPVEDAKRIGSIVINQFDAHPRALAYRRAVYRAVKRGLLKRVKSPPSRARYIATPPHTTGD